QRQALGGEIFDILGKLFREQRLRDLLIDATIDFVLERYRDLLKRGTMLVDPHDTSENIRILSYLEHTIQEARIDRSGNRRVISRQLQFVELDSHGQARTAGYAPYLDYRPLADDECALVTPLLDQAWLQDDMEGQALAYAVDTLVPGHLADVRRREELVAKTIAAVKERLTTEIAYWDHRAEELKAQEAAGRQPRMNWQRARQRADDLQARLQRRMTELEQERHLSPLPPVVIGGALIVPAGLLARLQGQTPQAPDRVAHDTEQIERLAMAAVIAAERRLGFEPYDISGEKRGYDIESRVPGTGQLRFIEVKGRVAGAQVVTITKNEILTALNKPDDFILAVVLVDGGAATPWYIRRPFQREPDFGVTSVNYDLEELLARAEYPA
ncbi:MAG TPA: DUF3883 domain-containing protein, partial [Candidatus Tectomicrobia bacterium]